MNRKAIIAIVSIYLFLYLLNYLHPMAFGDDYLYSFIWQGKPMSVPISEDAVRVSSWHDLFVSQWSHYFTWGGRTVAHVLVQFFVWMGKDIFNYFNALVGTLLVAEIYWCINKGHISFDFNADTLCWIFFVIWAFTPGFTPVFFWLTGACNYLWTNVILIGFQIFYIRKFYDSDFRSNYSIFFATGMFFGGIIAGWTNENSVCWIILVLMAFILRARKKDKEKVEAWMYIGFLGLIIGYLLLIFAPGNAARLYAEQSGGSNWLNAKALKEDFNMILMITFFQIFLWFFSLRALYSLKQLKDLSDNLKKEILLAKVFCALAFCMSVIMFFSPGFPARSGFSGTLQLIIAVGILLRIQREYNIELIQNSAKTFLFYVGIIYFVMTSFITVKNVYHLKLEMQEVLALVQQAQKENKNEILEVKPFIVPPKMEEVMSGFHIPEIKLSDNENDWFNVAVARYYGIKGIRVIKDKTDVNTEDAEENEKALQK